MWARDLRPLIAADQWNGYFTFAFVRNPWDRLVAWHNIIEVLRSGPERERWIATIAAVREVERCGCRTFEDFVQRCTSTFQERNGERVSFARPQVEHLSDENGDLLVDFVGRFENVDEDYAAVLERLGLPPSPLPHKNAHWHRHYGNCYTDEFRDVVRDRFRDDIDRFGYGFESIGPWRNIARTLAVTSTQVIERIGRLAARRTHREQP